MEKNTPPNIDNYIRETSKYLRQLSLSQKMKSILVVEQGVISNINLCSWSLHFYFTLLHIHVNAIMKSKSQNGVKSIPISNFFILTFRLFCSLFLQIY